MTFNNLETFRRWQRVPSENKYYKNHQLFLQSDFSEQKLRSFGTATWLSTMTHKTELHDFPINWLSFMYFKTLEERKKKMLDITHQFQPYWSLTQSENTTTIHLWISSEYYWARVSNSMLAKTPSYFLKVILEKGYYVSSAQLQKLKIKPPCPILCLCFFNTASASKNSNLHLQQNTITRSKGSRWSEIVHLSLRRVFTVRHIRNKWKQREQKHAADILTSTLTFGWTNGFVWAVGIAADEVSTDRGSRKGCCRQARICTSRCSHNI